MVDRVRLLARATVTAERPRLRMLAGDERSDAELVAACLRRDEAAAAKLFRRHARRIAGIAHRLAGPDHVDDLVQETFAEGFASLRRLREPERFEGWVAVIAVRKAKRLVAKILRAPAQRLALLESLVESAPLSDEIVDAYRRLTRLAPQVYVAWMLRRVEGFTIAQTAELCDVGTTTVKRWVARGDAELEEGS
jgi:RNA polymerase sigma factor (sigma-70 family)